MVKNKKVQKKDSLIKYFIAGILAAVILFMIFSLIFKDENSSNTINHHVWSPEMDSIFVKNCYLKYKPQIKDDLQKQENMKAFCKCMLEKVKTKYDERDMDKVRDKEIMQWDAECREQILNPNNLKVK